MGPGWSQRELNVKPRLVSDVTKGETGSKKYTCPPGNHPVVAHFQQYINHLVNVRCCKVLPKTQLNKNRFQYYNHVSVWQLLGYILEYAKISHAILSGIKIALFFSFPNGFKLVLYKFKVWQSNITGRRQSPVVAAASRTLHAAFVLSWDCHIFFTFVDHHDVGWFVSSCLSIWMSQWWIPSGHWECYPNIDMVFQSLGHAPQCTLCCPLTAVSLLLGPVWRSVVLQNICSSSSLPLLGVIFLIHLNSSCFTIWSHFLPQDNKGAQDAS